MTAQRSISTRLLSHLAGDGTANDSTTDELYREAHGITDGRDTDLEEVEKWAHGIVSAAAPTKPTDLNTLREQTQAKLPLITICNDAYDIGYWAREAGLPVPYGDDEAIAGWLDRDEEIRTGSTP